MNDEQIDRVLQAMADSFGQQPRSPILHWPSEQGLDYEDITFPALDGVPLEGWFSRCLGCSSTFAAMTQFPAAFDGVRCLVGPQPVTMKTIVQRRLALLGVPANRIDNLKQRVIVMVRHPHDLNPNADNWCSTLHHHANGVVTDGHSYRMRQARAKRRTILHNT